MEVTGEKEDGTDGARASARPRNLYTLVQKGVYRVEGEGGLNLLLAFNDVCKLYLEGVKREREKEKEENGWVKHVTPGTGEIEE